MRKLMLRLGIDRLQKPSFGSLTFAISLMMSGLPSLFPFQAHAAPYPEPNPPVVDLFPGKAPLAPPASPRLRATPQEWLYHKSSDGEHPSGEEQAMLWLTNTARANPPAEGVWLATSSDPAISQGRDYFNVDTAMLQAEFNGYSPTPPTAFDIRLYRAAYNHSLDLIARDAQDHNGQFERVEEQGFSYSSLGGNVFSYADGALNAHAGFNIDWGPGAGNMQTGRGHRVNKLSINKTFANVGIAMVAENSSATRVGPYVVTENYAAAASWVSDGAHFNRFLVGTVWEDKNGNARYDAGEGFANVQVRAEQGDYYAITGVAGGYAFPLTAEGAYTVTFSGGPFTQPVSKEIRVGTDSVLLDYQFQGGAVEPTAYALDVSLSGDGQVSSADGSIQCGTLCSHQYGGGETVNLRAEPGSGYSFSGWGGACSGIQQGACSLTMNGAQSVIAYFSPISETALSSGVSVSGSATQGEWYYYRMDAAAADNRLRVELAGLSRDLDLYVKQGAQPSLNDYDCRPLLGGASAESCILDNVGATTWYIGVQAYESGPFTLTATLTSAAPDYDLSVSNGGNGRITSTPAGIDCGSVCAYRYPGGTAVSLIASPDEGYVFSGWGGACGGSTTRCELTLDASREVTALFEKLPDNGLVSDVSVQGTLALNEWHYYQISAGAEHSSLEVTLSGLSDDLDLYVNPGEQASENRFECRPYLGGNATETCVLSNSGATVWYIGIKGYAASGYTLTARLLSGATYELSLSNSGNGSVLSTPAGIDCGADCSHRYGDGTQVTLHATPSSGYLFAGWGGACSGQESQCSVTMSAAQSVSAVFAPFSSQTLSSGTTVSGHIAQNTWQDFTLTTEQSGGELKVELYGLSDDVDLLVQADQPVMTSADCISAQYGTASEQCTLANSKATTWHISLFGYADADYTLKATFSGGAVSDPVTGDARLINISTRARISGNANDAFAGFVLQGNGEQSVMVRGIAVESGTDPSMSLLWQNGSVWDSVASNDEWENDSNAAAVGALPGYLQLPDNFGNDAGLLRSLGAGVYTAQLSSQGSAGLEVIGVDATSESGPRLINISTRAYISGGDNDAIAGFVIAGEGGLRIMLRGIAVSSGVDPRLTLQKFNGSSWETVLSNDEWEAHDSADAIRDLPAYLQLPDNFNNDAGALLQLDAGVYSLILSSGGAPGLAVVGVDVVE